MYILNHENTFRFIGTGLGIPALAMTNEDIRLTRNPLVDCLWAQERLGIYERRIADKGTLTSDLAAQAIRTALKQSGVRPDSIDLLIVATATPDRQAPSCACITQAKTGLVNAVAFDIAAVCSGFLYGLVTAAAYLRSGTSKRAIVVGADIFSRITDWTRRDCVFFGDGAGAVILESCSTARGFFEAELYSDGTKSEAFTVPQNETTFRMDAPGVMEAATYAIPLCVDRLMARTGFIPDDIDIVVPHQPSIGLLKKIATLTGVPFSKFTTNMDRYANTAGGTIPIALHEAYESGSIKPDSLLMFAAAGAGFTAGAALYRWQ